MRRPRFAASSAMSHVEDKRRAFWRLHESGCFAIPNPWDIGSALYLQHLGFKAIATTSAGFAFSRGLPDGAVGRDEMLAHIRELVEATDVPVNADFENGYADNPDDVAESVRLCVATGVAGLSIEDATDRKEQRLYDVDLAVERIQAAREAMGESGVLLVGRAEGFLVGRENFDQVIRRLTAYSAAGADCLYAPGASNPDEIAQIVKAVAPKPVNVLVSGFNHHLSFSQLADLGVRRISVGSGLALAAWGAFLRAAEDIKTNGTFNLLANNAASADLNELFQEKS